MPVSISILLADDHGIMREGLRGLLEDEPDMEVVGEAADGHAAVELAKRLCPTIVLMDIKMPLLNGIEATRQIISASPESRVLALTTYSDSRLVARMLEAGASGYLLKQCAFDELVHAVRTVTAGRTYLSPKIAKVKLDEYSIKRPGARRAANSVLTARERRVLQLLAEGHSTREVAELLSLSLKTVETHRSNIMRKLNTRSIARLTKFAIREGLTSLDH
ncbi:MAG: DNA-binding response regulator [Deltaproteobacteria bacterium 21-66-5]|nr:MAG: DNA-binding response regulator [Deltaproteobacteria bacterium 21-66-5]